MTTDDLAGLLREHAVAAISYTGREVDGICCASPECAEGDLAIEFSDMDAFAAHQGAVIAAAGWMRGREEFGVRDGEDVDEIEPPTRGWAERLAAADNAYLRRNGMEGESIVVRRHVTDWEPVE